MQVRERADCITRFKILADPTRFSIFDLLMTGNHCHCEIAEELNLSLSLVSHHLRVLVEGGLITAIRDERDARWVHYYINQEALAGFRLEFTRLTDPARIQARTSDCPPQQ